MRGNIHHHEVIEQVPVDYYQKGVKNNFFQKTWHKNKLKAVLSFMPSNPRKILDIGCASGWFISQISSAFPKAECYGIDIYEKGILYARKLYPHIKFKVADAHNIPFNTKMFDLVICTEVLEHVDNPRQVLSEIHRILKTDGVAIIELDSGSLLFAISWFIWKQFNGIVWKDAHLYSFTANKLERIIVASGFKIVKKKKFNLGMAMVFLIKKKNE